MDALEKAEMKGELDQPHRLAGTEANPRFAKSLRFFKLRRNRHEDHLRLVDNSQQKIRLTINGNSEFQNDHLKSDEIFYG